MNKTPRDWLLERHGESVAQLHRAREKALPTPSVKWAEFLPAIFRPHQTAWSMIALVWIALLAFRFGTTPATALSPAVPPRPEAVTAWLVQIKSYEGFVAINHQR